MSRQGTRLRGLVALVSAVALASGCAGGSGSGGDDDSGPLEIGLAQPLTGPVAAAGIAVRHGAELAVEEINADGGVKGRKLKLVTEDDANDPATCTNVAQKLAMQRQVPAIIGFWGSSCTLAAIPVLERAGIPLVVETSGSDAITDPKGSWNEKVFRLAPTGGQEAAAISTVLADELHTKSFFQLAVNNDFGRSFADAYSKELAAAKAKDTGRAYFDQADQDFSSQVTKARRSGADTIIVITDAGQIASILKELKAQGNKAKVMTSGGSNNVDEVMRLAGKSAGEGHYASTYFPYFDPSLSEQPDRAKQFVTDWTDAGHHKGDLSEAARGYDAVHAVASAFEHADDPTDPEDISAGLKALDAKGIMFGDMRFSDWHSLKQQNSPPVFLTRVEGGKATLVAEAKPPY